MAGLASGIDTTTPWSVVTRGVDSMNGRSSLSVNVRWMASPGGRVMRSTVEERLAVEDPCLVTGVIDELHQALQRFGNLVVQRPEVTPVGLAGESGDLFDCGCQFEDIALGAELRDQFGEELTIGGRTVDKGPSLGGWVSGSRGMGLSGLEERLECGELCLGQSQCRADRRHDLEERREAPDQWLHENSVVGGDHGVRGRRHSFVHPWTIVAMATRILRGPANGALAWETSMLSSIIMSPASHAKRTDRASYSSMR